MKTSLITRVRRASLVLLGLLAVAGCASTSPQLPVETTGSSHGSLGDPRVFTSGAKLYVAGSMKRHIGHAVPMAAHVDIQLIDREGRVIAEKQDDIDTRHPRQDHRHMRRYAYVASFPAELAARAVKVRVSYHAESHS